MPTTAAIQTLSGPLSGWPNASNSPSGGTNYWTTGTGANRRSWRLETTLKTNVTGAQPPIFTQADFAKKVAVTYATAMPAIYSSGVSSKVTNETVSLELQPVLTPGALLQQRTLANQCGHHPDLVLLAEAPRRRHDLHRPAAPVHRNPHNRPDYRSRSS